MVTKPQVFLVDDDVDDQEIFQMALQEIDTEINCAVAGNGIEALQKLNADSTYVPGYIFLDINMHKMNGTECLQHIRQIDRLKDSQVIMFSTSTDEAIIRRCLESGANDFLAKPPGLTQLVELLRNLLKAN